MIKLKCFTKKVDLGKGRKFTSYYSPMKLIIKGEEDKGKQITGVTVRFAKECDLKGFTGGFLYVEDDKIYAPFKYEIKTTPLGKQYPFIYIKKISKFENFKIEKTETPLQDSFELDDVEEKDKEEIK